jgi:predicted RNA-binding Zn-ribbon protein involved in translation (DUF1610 family)
MTHLATYSQIEKDLSFPCSECGEGIEEVVLFHKDRSGLSVDTECNKCGKKGGMYYNRCKKCGAAYPSESDLFNFNTMKCWECGDLEEE